MWQHHFETTTDIGIEAIWAVLADVKNWPNVDQNIESIDIFSSPARGVGFKLKPKGGPRLSFVIGDFEPPTSYSDVCALPFAKMSTLHTLIPGAKTTIVRAEITIRGPLAWFWGRLVGRKHAAGLPALTDRMLRAAGAQI